MKQEFLHNKTRLLRIYSSVLSDMRVDRGDKKMSSINFQNIWEWISNFSKRLEELQLLFSDLQKVSYLKKSDFLSSEGPWIINFSQEFSNLLNDWLLFHKSELDWLSHWIQKIDASVDNISLKKSLLNHHSIITTQIDQIQTLIDE